MIHWVVQRWDEDQSETICEGVFHSEDRAESHAAAVAAALASNTGREIRITEDSWGVKLRIVYSEDYAHEPTDDERHHAIWIQKVQSPA